MDNAALITHGEGDGALTWANAEGDEHGGEQSGEQNPGGDKPGENHLVALIDTGVPEGDPNVEAAWSVLAAGAETAEAGATGAAGDASDDGAAGDGAASPGAGGAEAGGPSAGDGAGDGGAGRGRSAGGSGPGGEAAGSPWDDSGHGTAMLETMRGENPDLRVLSVKALDSHGRGTAASVMAAIQVAREAGAEVVNLSLSGPANEGNMAIARPIREAVAHGIAVIAAAGNHGADARAYTPANIEEAFTVGAADQAKLDAGLTGEAARLASSNFGPAVDAYLPAQSTSRAAARASGRLSIGAAVGVDSGGDDGDVEAPERVSSDDVLASMEEVAFEEVTFAMVLGTVSLTECAIVEVTVRVWTGTNWVNIRLSKEYPVESDRGREFDPHSVTVVKGQWSWELAGWHTRHSGWSYGEYWGDGSDIGGRASVVIVSQTDLAVPPEDRTVVYSGTALSRPSGEGWSVASWPSDMTSAGTHTFTVRLTDPDACKWTDGTTADKTVTWVINPYFHAPGARRGPDLGLPLPGRPRGGKAVRQGRAPRAPQPARPPREPAPELGGRRLPAGRPGGQAGGQAAAWRLGDGRPAAAGRALGGRLAPRPKRPGAGTGGLPGGAVRAGGPRAREPGTVRVAGQASRAPRWYAWPTTRTVPARAGWGCESGCPAQGRSGVPAGAPDRGRPPPVPSPASFASRAFRVLVRSACALEPSQSVHRGASCSNAADRSASRWRAPSAIPEGPEGASCGDYGGNGRCGGEFIFNW